ncbi:NBS-LRR type disease resistance protein [Medicago truncatula]|uniref:NBS-LRR type disease resistance protein n=1 Tax=Medicago truncatula TaxID=3880 RepID=A0A072VFX8_MEDTR|nr:NBS-LRR type disease resistance protein [Medicago truncatula]
MEILISIVGKIAEYTVVPIGRQTSYLIFYKGNFKTLKDHVEDLEAARERMIHSVESERENGKEIEKDVLNWLEKVDGVIKVANQLQNDSRNANVRCSPWSFPNLILRHQLSRNARKIANNVVEVVQGKEKFNSVGHFPPLDVVASSSTRDGEKYDTRESLKEDIVKALADPTSRNIGVYGLGGVGKTTLVEKVAQIAKELKLFHKVVKTEVSKNPDIKRIQGEIADFMGLRFEEETILGRAQRLRQTIKMKKSILIILDNIWTILDLKEVGIPVGDEHNGDEHNGCKLLMTSRDEDVLLQMDVPKDFTFKVKLMRENETWSLFQFMAGDVVKDSNLKDLPFQVARKCEGLPLRVVTVARAMKNKRDVQSWKDALRKLQSNDHTEMDPGTYSALELSYNSLESDDMRALFLLFALFLDEQIEYFLKVAMGLDILKHLNAIDDARNRLYRIIKSLEAACLLLEVKTVGNIQMHDFVRDFAISIARRDKHIFLRKQSDEEWPTNDFLKRCTQIFLKRCHTLELPQTIDCPNVKLFYLGSNNSSFKIPDAFFEGMRSLRVLDLTHLNLLSLPTSFRLLRDLQTLCLHQCVLENMDALEALQNLEILCLWKSSMIKLPREIGRLIRLRMLDLSHSGIEVVPPNIISSLTKLEELYMGNTSINWEDVSSTVHNENASLAELRKLPNLTALELQIRETWMLPRDLQLVFEKLERYKIAIGDVWDWSDIKDGTLKTLMLKLGTNIHLEHGIKALIKGVENLYLDDVDGIQNVLPNLNREGFTLLKHLHVQNNTNLNHIVDNKERNQIHFSFPILETLVLLNLRNLEHICHAQPSVASFGSLSVIKVKNCIQLKYLFSFTMVKGLSHLCKIEVCECNSMKDIVFRDNNSSANISDEKIEFLQLRSLTLEHLETLDNFASDYLTHHRSKEKYQGLEPYAYTTPFFNNAQVRLLNLEKIILKDMNNLKTIWHRQFEILKMLEVNNCKKIVVVFPSSMQNTYNELEKLEVTNCALVEEIFELNLNENNSDEVTTHLKEVTIDGLLKLKKIWSGDPEGILSFQNLIYVQLESCASLEYLLPFSVATRCSHLKELVIKWCENIKEIVAEEKESSLSAASIFEFNQLSTLLLWNLTKLNGFYAGNHTLACPSLRKINVSRCTNLKLFRTLSTRSSNFRDDKPSVLTQPPLFIAEEVIPNLELLRMVQADADMILQTQNSSSLFCKMTYLGLASYNTDDARFPYWFLENVYTLENLLVEWVRSCSSLTNLMPSSATLNHLTKLEIKDCNSLEEVVNGVENVDIAFISLQILNLECLPSLIKFSSSKCFMKFPLLEEVIVRECPQMKIFSEGNTSTPILQKVKIAENNSEWLWKGNLNNTIYNMFENKVAFGKLKYLALSDYPELKDVWYGQLHCNVFCSLKHLVVERCDFLSHVLFSSNVMQLLQTLEELEVKDCDSLEAVFDVKGMKSQEILIKESTQLKRLSLSTLPKLKHIWNEDPHEIISFVNLHKVDVSLCQSLLYVFPYSLCPDLGHLEMLEISSCGVKEIVAMEETVSMEIQFNFPQLKIMTLRHLSNLKSFYQGKHTLDCPLLKTFNVYRCEALRMFSFNNSDLQQPYSVDQNQGMLFQQPLFCIEKLSPNLEELAVSGTDMLGILNGCYQENIFHKVEFLRLQLFDETPTIFMNDLHIIFPNLQEFQVRNSSFEILFPTKGATDHLNMQISKQMRMLMLFELEKLEHIWQEEFPLDHPLLQHLQELFVLNCPSLISLVPPFASFTNLTYLKVDNCKELVYLITYSTAKSLVQLKTLIIENCEKMLDAVKIDEEKGEEDIIFENLEYLELASLSSLRSFCYGKQAFIFPYLLCFIVKGCPQMKIFSSALTVAPCLTSIEVEKENMRWKGDLNTTIEQMFKEKEVPHSN